MQLQGRRKRSKETEWGKLLHGILSELFGMSKRQANL